MLTFGQQQVAQVDAVGQAANGQVAVAGVVDAKVQHELLLQQSGPHHLDLDQMHLWFRGFFTLPGRAAAEPDEQQQAGDA
ncbi:hypothetical protein D3C78_1408340 [compost metagenome]